MFLFTIYSTEKKNENDCIKLLKKKKKKKDKKIWNVGAVAPVYILYSIVANKRIEKGATIIISIGRHVRLTSAGSIPDNS